MKTHVATTIAFQRGGNSDDYVLHGWHAQEPLFRWTSTPETGLAMPMPEAPHGCYIELLVQPLIRSPGPDKQRISLAANGRGIGSATLTRQAILAFYIPPIQGDLTLTIRNYDAYAALPGEPAIALCFTRVRLLVLDEPIPPNYQRVEGPPASHKPFNEMGYEFVSLGKNCEFGFAQRRFGCEPLDLLKFAGIPLIPLIQGIDTSFEGLETDDNLRPEAEGQWGIVRDRKYNMAYHTFAERMAWEVVLKREKKRLRYLANKLIDDLRLGEKTFIWWQYESAEEAEILPLYLAVRRHGPSRLLWVSPGDPLRGVREALPGLLIGQISRLTDPQDRNPADLAEHWGPVLAAASQYMPARDPAQDVWAE